MSRARGTDVSFTRMAGSAKPRQEKVRGPINRNCDYHEIGDHIEPARDRILFVPDSSCPVHVKLRAPQMADRNQNTSRDRLQPPRSAIVAKPLDGPEKQRRNDQVI